MNLKTATILAIVGASIATALGVISLIARYVPALAEVLYSGRGVVVNVLYLAVSIT